MTNRSSFEVWVLKEVDRLGPGDREGDPEGWHHAADDVLLACLGKRLSAETVDLVRSWYDKGTKWYA